MISKNLIKYIRSLELKKNRQKEGVFVAEGPKVVGDLSEIYNPERLIATEEWYKANNKSARPQDVTVTDDELKNKLLTASTASDGNIQDTYPYSGHQYM